MEEQSGDLPNDWLSFNPVDLASTRQDWEEEKEDKKKDEKEEEKEEDKEEEEGEDASLAASRMTHIGVPAREGGGIVRVSAIPSLDPQSQLQLPFTVTVMADDSIQFDWHLNRVRRQWERCRFLSSALWHFSQDERRQ